MGWGGVGRGRGWGFLIGGSGFRDEKVEGEGGRGWVSKRGRSRPHQVTTPPPHFGAPG